MKSISYSIYSDGMNGGQFEFQSVDAVIFFIIIVAITAIQMRTLGKRGEQL